MLVRKLRNFVTFTSRSAASANPKLTSFSEKKIKIGKYDINYLKVGEGPHNVVLIPGTLGTIWSNYKLQIEGFDLEKFTLVVFDPQGYGKSFPPERELHIKSYERDADTAYELMEHLKIPKYSVMGWSAGGCASMILAGKHPDVMKRLVVWATNAYMLQKEIEIYKNIRDISVWDEEFRNLMIKIYGEERLSRYWIKWVNGMINVFRHNKEIVSQNLLRNISCPTFILYGKKDVLLDGSHLSYLTENINNTYIHLYPEGKHNIHMRYSEDFNKRVQEFLLRN